MVPTKPTPLEPGTANFELIDKKTGEFVIRGRLTHLKDAPASSTGKTFSACSSRVKAVFDDSIVTGNLNLGFKNMDM